VIEGDSLSDAQFLMKSMGGWGGENGRVKNSQYCFFTQNQMPNKA
jgi:hypothetical protein